MSFIPDRESALGTDVDKCGTAGSEATMVWICSFLRQQGSPVGQGCTDSWELRAILISLWAGYGVQRTSP